MLIITQNLLHFRHQLPFYLTVIVHQRKHTPSLQLHTISVVVTNNKTIS
jgi:hypothetical protein